MSALRRVAGAAVWALGLWLIFVLLAKAASLMVGTAAATALSPHAGPVPGREDLFAVAQLTYLHPGLRATAANAPVLMGLAGVLAWTLCSGIVIARLGGTTGASALGEVGLRTLPSILLQSLWHVALRVVFLMVIAVSLGPLSEVAMLIALAFAWVISSLALDLTRIGVVLHGARPLHPGTALWAFVRAAKAPRLLAITTGLGLLQWIIAGALASAGIAAVGPGSSSLNTALLSALGVLVGLLRLSVVIGHGPVALRSMSEQS